MITYSDIDAVFGPEPPPFAGTKARLDIDGVLRCEARAVGSWANDIVVDIVTATSALITQRDLIAAVARTGHVNRYINVDVSLTLDNTGSATTAAGDREVSNAGGQPDGEYLPLLILSKIGAGTPNLASGLQVTGGRDPVSTSFSAIRLADAVNAIMGRPTSATVGMRSLLSFLAANPNIARTGSWGAQHWGDLGGHNQASWDALKQSCFDALSDPTEQ